MQLFIMTSCFHPLTTGEYEYEIEEVYNIGRLGSEGILSVMVKSFVSIMKESDESVDNNKSNRLLLVLWPNIYFDILNFWS